MIQAFKVISWEKFDGVQMQFTLECLSICTFSLWVYISNTWAHRFSAIAVCMQYATAHPFVAFCCRCKGWCIYPPSFRPDTSLWRTLCTYFYLRRTKFFQKVLPGQIFWLKRQLQPFQLGNYPSHFSLVTWIVLKCPLRPNPFMVRLYSTRAKVNLATFLRNIYLAFAAWD